MAFVSRLDRMAVAAVVEQAPELAQPRTELQSYRAHGGNLSAESRAQLSATKFSTVATGDQILAAAVWVLETIAKAQTQYVEAFQACQQDRYYDAWQSFERAEIQLSYLVYHFDDPNDRYGVAFMLEHIPRFQLLFPYKVFFSPGFIKLEQRCSICNHVVTPRKPCGHRVFELYDGEMCGRIITQMKLLEISVVEHPVQKYSVGFSSTPYNYGPVYCAVSRLRSAWDGWDIHTEMGRHKDPKFLLPPYAGCGRNAPCPCRSGKKYKHCCTGKSTYEVPHHVIHFKVPPPPGASLSDEFPVRYSVNDPVPKAKTPDSTEEEHASG